jgi:hypothetical protein
MVIIDDLAEKLIYLGLPKTASSSLSYLLSCYSASEHEYDHENACRVIWHHEKSGSDQILVDYFRNRAQKFAGHDIATFLHQLNFNLLDDAFPASKFFAVAREPDKWTASFLAMILDYSNRVKLSQITTDFRFFRDYASKISPSLSFLGFYNQVESKKYRDRIIHEFLEYWIVWFTKIQKLSLDKQVFIYTDICRLQRDISICYQRLNRVNVLPICPSLRNVWINKCPKHYAEFKQLIVAEVHDIPLFLHALELFHSIQH